MAAGRRIAWRVSVALVTATATLVPPAPARADPGCNFLDMINAGANALGALATPQCAAASAEDGGVVASYVIAGLLEGASALNSGAVNGFCTGLAQAQDDINTIQTALNALGISVDLAAALGGLDPLSIVECGCTIQQSVSALASDVGACACDLLNAIPGVHCGCSNPPPPVQANCALPSTCFTGSSDPACQTGNAIMGCSNFLGSLPGAGPHCTGNEQDGANGAFVSTHIGDPNCGALLYCFCPKPLVPTWTSVPPLPGTFGNPLYSGVFTCLCPSGTYQARTASGEPMTSAGVPVCLCDYTNQPPKVTDNPQDMCPLNLLGPCQAGQISRNGRCITPCSDPTKGMTQDGACCDPSMVTACGQCCPPRTIPNPANGSCWTPGQAQ
jgi:hypothetical protein